MSSAPQTQLTAWRQRGSDLDQMVSHQRALSRHFASQKKLHQCPSSPSYTLSPRDHLILKSFDWNPESPSSYFTSSFYNTPSSTFSKRRNQSKSRERFGDLTGDLSELVSLQSFNESSATSSSNNTSHENMSLLSSFATQDTLTTSSSMTT
jgi:hypothetical protein